MKRTILGLLLVLLSGAALAQSEENLGWNIATTSDPAWESDHNFISPAL